MANIYSMVDTWDAGATTFTGIGLNVTDTASASGSLLMDLQVGGSSKFKVTKAGGIQFQESGSSIGYDAGRQAFTVFSRAGVYGFYMYPTYLSLGGYSLAFTAGGNPIGTPNIYLSPDAAGTLAQRNSTNAQTFNLYNTYDNGGVDYERGFMKWNSNVLEIGTEAAGTGTARVMTLLAAGELRLGSSGAQRLRMDSAKLFPVSAGGMSMGTAALPFHDLFLNGDDIRMTALPATDPVVAGRLWNDAGTLKVSAG